MMNYIQEPYFSDLRTKQQIGYVVFSRHSQMREVIVCQFLVQSSEKSCEFIINATNNFLTELREKVKELSDEDFNTQKQAVHTKISEKDINLQKENDRYSGEISLHKYNFGRQQSEIEDLAKITKDQLIAQFEQVFFSDQSRRIDFSLTAEARSAQNTEDRETTSKHEMYKES
jgi:secreted Zn-dependent insulinase-like peptidase